MWVASVLAVFTSVGSNSNHTCHSVRGKVFPPYMATYASRNRPLESTTHHRFALCGLVETGSPSVSERNAVHRAYRDVRSVFQTNDSSLCMRVHIVYETSQGSSSGSLITVGLWNYTHIILFTDVISSLDQARPPSIPCSAALDRFTCCPPPLSRFSSTVWSAALHPLRGFSPRFGLLRSTVWSVALHGLVGCAPRFGRLRPTVFLVPGGMVSPTRRLLDVHCHGARAVPCRWIHPHQLRLGVLYKQSQHDPAQPLHRVPCSQMRQPVFDRSGHRQGALVTKRFVFWTHRSHDACYRSKNVLVKVYVRGHYRGAPGVDICSV